VKNTTDKSQRIPFSKLPFEKRRQIMKKLTNFYSQENKKSWYKRLLIYLKKYVG